MPAENSPRVVFERMFGDSNSTDPAERLARIRRRRSILEVVGEQAGRLVASVGPSDRGKLTEYFDAIRDVERRIDIAEEQSSREMPKLGRPAGVPANFEEHAKLMFDLQVLAYQTDLTRVITFMLGSEQSARTYNEIGIADPHHPLTHHNGDTAKIAKVSEINIYHTRCSPITSRSCGPHPTARAASGSCTTSRLRQQSERRQRACAQQSALAPRTRENEQDQVGLSPSVCEREGDADGESPLDFDGQVGDSDGEFRRQQRRTRAPLGLGSHLRIGAEFGLQAGRP